MQTDNLSLIEKQLVNTLKHPIVQTIYEYIIGLYAQAKLTSSKKPNSLLACFQDFVKTIQTMPSTLIIEETEKIKTKSNFNKIDLDILLDAIVKTKIYILSRYNTNKFELFNHKVDLTAFIHKCYIESGKYAHNESYLIYQEGIPPLEISKNINKFKKLIENAIDHSIDFMVPLNLILPNYIATIKNLNPRNVSFIEDDTSEKSNNSLEVGNEIAKNFVLQNADNKYSNSVVQKENNELNNIRISQKQPIIPNKNGSPKNDELKIGGIPSSKKANEKNSLTVISPKQSIRQNNKQSTSIKPSSVHTTNKSDVSTANQSEDSADDSEYQEITETSERDVITRRMGNNNNKKKRVSDHKTPLEQFG